MTGRRHLRLVESPPAKIPVMADQAVLLAVGTEIFACIGGEWALAHEHPKLKPWLDRIANAGPDLVWPVLPIFPGPGFACP